MTVMFNISLHTKQYIETVKFAFAYCALLTDRGNRAQNTFHYVCSSAGNFKHDHLYGIIRN